MKSRPSSGPIDGPSIGVVGPCAAGKTTLVDNLRSQGWTARQISQEHSFVPDMWERITRPDLLIYLDVSYQEAMNRRTQQYSPADHDEQHQRLVHARDHADLYVMTDALSSEQVLQKVLNFLSP